eukprot:6591944-Heterocapsa_arctica.AAC.1
MYLLVQLNVLHSDRGPIQLWPLAPLEVRSLQVPGAVGAQDPLVSLQRPQISWCQVCDIVEHALGALSGEHT